MGFIRKALEKGYLEHPGSAVLTIDFRPFWTVPVLHAASFVDRQLLCLHTNSHNVLLLPLMHHKSLRCTKGLALGVQDGCRCMSLVAGPKRLVLPSHSNLHAPTRSTRF